MHIPTHTGPPVAPRHAATVILLRDSTRGMEVFMVKRSGKSSFMANAYVYPGGRLDPEDTHDALRERSIGLSPQEAQKHLSPHTPTQDNAALSPSEALGLYIAALREMFEEAGVLIARTSSGRLVLSTQDADQRNALALARDALNDRNNREASFVRLVQDLNLTLDLGALTYFAHWITPTVETKRYNTRFFIALAPPEQEALHDNTEVVQSAWLTPSEALNMYEERSIQLAPPTLRTLEDLSAWDSAHALIQHLKQNAFTPPTIVPIFQEIEGALTLLLPGDPLHPDSCAMGGPTRVVMDQGRWWSKTEK